MKRLPPTSLFLVIILFITFGSVAVNGQARKRPRGKATRRTAAATESAANLTDRLIRLTDNIDPEIRLSLRLRAADALQNTYPDLAHKLVDLSIRQISKSSNVALEQSSFDTLARLAPSDTVMVLPHLSPGSDQSFLQRLAWERQTETALILYRGIVSRGELALPSAKDVIHLLMTRKPDEAVKLFQEIAAKFPFDSASSVEVWNLLQVAWEVKSVAPALVADICERVIKLATPADYGKTDLQMVVETLKLDSATIETKDTRETLLVESGSALYRLAPERFEKVKSVFGERDLTKPLSVVSWSFPPARVGRPAAVSPAGSQPNKLQLAINDNIKLIQKMPAGADRSRLISDTAKQIQSLPFNINKTSLSYQLSSSCLGFDLERPEVDALSDMLADVLPQELRQNNGPPDFIVARIITLARLSKYESGVVPKQLPGVQAAIELLNLRDKVNQQAGFVLTGLDGKQYSLTSLHGKVVLLNFWATWCGPCRAELPTFEKLSREFEKQGLVVLAVSDEDRQKVERFIRQEGYTFTVLLDPRRELNSAFDIVGVPQSFIFDREGKIVAQITSVRTEQQFRELLKRAGLE